MRQSESIAKLAPALVKAVSEMGAVGKSGNNTFDRYTYAKLEDYVRAAAPVLAKHGLCVVSGTAEVATLEDRLTANGKPEHVCRVHVVMRIVHESGEWIEADSAGEGQDRADKATYKAITGARKYGLASLLCLATSDDPEADETVGQSQGKPKAKADRPRSDASYTPRPLTAPPPPPPLPAEDVNAWKAGLSEAEVRAREEAVDGIWEMWKQMGKATTVKTLAEAHKSVRAVLHKQYGTTLKLDHYASLKVKTSGDLERWKRADRKAAASEIVG